MTTERPPLNLDIDEHNLHAEFAELPGMFAVWKRHQAQVESDLDQAEAERDLEIAKAADRLRKGTEKTTEAAIKTQVLLDPAVEEAIEKVNSLKKSKGVIRAAVEGIIRKETSLKKMADLYVHEYYQQRKDTLGNVDMDDEDERMRIRREAIERRRSNGTV